MEQTQTIGCPLDCPDACSLSVQMKGGRIQRIDAAPDNPLTQGFICGKVRSFGQHVHAPERLRHPLLRKGPKGSGRFERISWDSALGRIADRLGSLSERGRGERILPLRYGGSNGHLSQEACDARLFRRLGASHLHRSICAATNGRAISGVSGKMIGVPFADYLDAELIVIWGANPSATSIHHLPLIVESQKRGARLVVIDPRRIPLAKRADHHLALQPGSDLPLALGIIRWLFHNDAVDRDFLTEHTKGWEELRRRADPWTLSACAESCGLEAEAIEAVAQLYAASSPAVIRLGWGVERSRSGGSASAAIISIPAVAGKFGVRGGGYTASNGSSFSFDTEAAIAEPSPSVRSINMSRLGRELRDANPPIDLLFVYDTNPLSTHPNAELVREGFLREGLFTVVFDQVMTESARHADIVLPATTFFEHPELSNGYGALHAQSWGPAVETGLEARSNREVFLELIDRLGLAKAGDPRSPEELHEALGWKNDPAISYRSRPFRTGEGQGEIVQFGTVWPKTEDRKMHLIPDELDREAPLGLHGHRPDPRSEMAPYALISPALARLTNSSFGYRYRSIVPVEMNPQDAAAEGLRDGQKVRMHNNLSEVITDLRLSADQRRGVLFLPKGLWPHNTHNGATANSLCPDTLSDLGQGACYNDTRVGIEAADS